MMKQATHFRTRGGGSLGRAALLATAFSLTPGLALADQELSPRQIYKVFGKGVVLVFATDGSSQGSAGTGSIITPDGQVITNAHVVAKEGRPYKKLFVYLKPDKLQGSMRDDLKDRHEATLVDLDPQLDLALLKIKRPPADLTVIPLANPDDVEIGEPVVAIGHPETAGLWTMTRGVISSVVKDFQGIPGKDIFQTDASVNRGNSGGPLLNAFGQMVGINTSISRRAADGLAITGINFSLKSSVPMSWLRKRDLLALNYAPAGRVPETAIAVAPPPPKADPRQPAPPTKPAGEAEKGYTVKTDDGTAVVVVEPEDENEEVADVGWETGGDAATVSSNRKVAAAKAKKDKPKILTRRRPYKMEPFVSARVKEIRALEQMMDDMSNEIDRRTGRKKGNKPDGKGMGLW